MLSIPLSDIETTTAEGFLAFDLITEMQVALCDLDVLMPHEILKGIDVDTLLQHFGGVSVTAGVEYGPHAVVRDALVEAEPATNNAKLPGDRGQIPLSAPAAWEYPVGRFGKPIHSAKHHVGSLGDQGANKNSTGKSVLGVENFESQGVLNEELRAQLHDFAAAKTYIEGEQDDVMQVLGRNTCGLHELAHLLIGEDAHPPIVKFQRAYASLELGGHAGRVASRKNHDVGVVVPQWRLHGEIENRAGHGQALCNSGRTQGFMPSTFWFDVLELFLHPFDIGSGDGGHGLVSQTGDDMMVQPRFVVLPGSFVAFGPFDESSGYFCKGDTLLLFSNGLHLLLGLGLLRGFAHFFEGLCPDSGIAGALYWREDFIEDAARTPSLARPTNAFLTLWDPSAGPVADVVVAVEDSPALAFFVFMIANAGIISRYFLVTQFCPLVAPSKTSRKGVSVGHVVAASSYKSKGIRRERVGLGGKTSVLLIRRFKVRFLGDLSL